MDSQTQHRKFMETRNSEGQSWDDLIFENRNRFYGAYAIRKSYDKNVLEAFLASILSGVIVLLLANWISSQPVLRVAKGAGIDSGYFPHPPPLIETIKKVRIVEPPITRKIKSNTIPVITQEDIDDAPVLSDSQPALSGTEDKAGEAFPMTGNVTGLSTGQPVIVAPQPILLSAEVMPTYNGGLEAMMNFVQKKLKYPMVARNHGIEGMVFVQFVVDGVGKVTDVQVIRGISPDCDREAARIIALMPDWKAGMQNNNPVSVRMVIPLNFKLDN